MKRLVRFLAIIIMALQLGIALLSTSVLAKLSVIQRTTPLRVLAFGDSLTAGFRVAGADAYPAQLQERMRGAGYNIEFINGGVSGDTSAQALGRIEWSLKRGPFDYALLCIGANDGLRQLSLVDFEKNFRKIIQRLQANHIKVILIGMQLPTNFPAEYRKTFASTFDRMAKEFKIPLYPFLLEGVTQIPALNLEDGLHPNRAGYAIIAHNLQKFLELVIQK